MRFNMIDVLFMDACIIVGVIVGALLTSDPDGPARETDDAPNAGSADVPPASPSQCSSMGIIKSSAFFHVRCRQFHSL